MYPHLFYRRYTQATLTLSKHNKEVNIMATNKQNVNTLEMLMKGERKMNSQKLNWANIYDGGDAHKIIENLWAERDYKELHAALWSWLSFNGWREKHEWFERFGVPAVNHYCFACEAAEPSRYYCPLTKPEVEECINGLYGKWLTTFGKEREEVAMEIASLEWTVK